MIYTAVQQIIWEAGWTEQWGRCSGVVRFVVGHWSSESPEWGESSLSLLITSHPSNTE